VLREGDSRETRGGQSEAYPCKCARRFVRPSRHALGFLGVPVFLCELMAIHAMDDTCANTYASAVPIKKPQQPPSPIFWEVSETLDQKNNIVIDLTNT
jgi:hypothetical protein